MEQQPPLSPDEIARGRAIDEVLQASRNEEARLGINDFDERFVIQRLMRRDLWHEGDTIHSVSALAVAASEYASEPVQHTQEPPESGRNDTAA